MKKHCLVVKGAPPAKGPYSHAVALERTLYLSAQGPFSPETGEVVDGDFEAQARQTLENIKKVAEGSGTGNGQLLKVTVYLDDMANFDAFNKVYQEFIPGSYPARTCIQVAGLPGGCKVMVDAIAALP